MLSSSDSFHSTDSNSSEKLVLYFFISGFEMYFINPRRFSRISSNSFIPARSRKSVCKIFWISSVCAWISGIFATSAIPDTFLSRSFRAFAYFFPIRYASSMWYISASKRTAFTSSSSGKISGATSSRTINVSSKVSFW